MNVTGLGVVVHLVDADPGRQSDVLRNVRNLLEELDGGSPIEVVVHGGGVTAALSASPNAEHVARLIGLGVTLAVCNNTLQARDIASDELIAGATIVPAGIAELVRRQRDGWAYLRP